MGRVRVTYSRQNDPVSRAQQQAASQAAQQRQAQMSQYAAQRFQEWQAGAQDREALMNARLQKAQSEAELAGAQFQYNMYKDNELRNQTTHYYTAMPQLQEQLKQAGILPGSPRYSAEMAAFASTIPDALTHNDAIRKDLHDYAKVDATQAEITNRLNTVTSALNQAGQRPTSFSTTAAGGVDVKATRPLDDSLKTLGLSPSEFLNHVNAKQGKFDAQGNFTDKGLAPGEQATAIQFQAGQSKDAANAGKLVTHNIPLAQFNQIRSDLGIDPLPAYSAPAAAQAAPVQTPAPAITAPQIGEVRNGYTFKGGNPADQNSWEQSQ